MKHTLYIMLALLVSSCVYEDLTDCLPPVGGGIVEPPEPPPGEVTKAIVFRVRDLFTQEDITDRVLADNEMFDAGFFMFDKDKNLIGVVQLAPEDIGVPIQFKAQVVRAVDGEYTLETAYASAWANMTAEFIENDDGTLRKPLDWLPYEVGNPMVNPIWGLTVDPSYPDDPTHRLCPGQLYFGLTDMTDVMVDPNAETRADDGSEEEIDIIKTIWVEIKNSLLSIQVIGLPEGSSDDDYYFKVRNLNCGYGYDGNPTIDNVQVLQKGKFNDEGHFVTPAPDFYIHSVDDITENNATIVDLYKVSPTRAGEDELIATTQDVEAKGGLITLPQGMQTHVLIELGEELNVTVSVKPWRDTIVQNE